MRNGRKIQVNNFLSELRRRNVFRVAGVYAVVGWVLAYLLSVEMAGFVITSAVLLGLWMLRLGNRWPVAMALGVLVAATTYQLFAVVLHVPLPWGWLGW